MQRKSIRATVGATDVDIPIHTFLANQVLVYAGGAITTEVRVRVVGAPTTGNLASWFNAETIQDSGLLVTDIVRNPGTSVTRQIAVFSDTTGKAIAAAPVQVDVAGALTLVTNINGRAVDSFVVGPASAVTGNLVSFNGTTGKLVQDAGVLPANLVTSTSTSTINQVVTWTGTGKAVQNVTVTIIGGALTNVATINTIDPATWVVGPASATANNLAVFNGTSGKLIKNSALDSTQVVTSGTAPTAGQLAFFTGTGVIIANATVTVSSGALTNVVTINSIDPATWVVGPASATTNNVASYNGTTGKLIKDSGVLTTNLVTAAANGVANKAAVFVGGSRAIIDDSLGILNGAISSITTLNGTNLTEYVIRNSATTTIGNLTKYVSTNGHTIDDSGILAANVATIPGSVTLDNIPAFSGTGKQLYDSGVSYTNLLTRTGSPANHQIAVWTSTSNVVGASTVQIDASGNITGVGTLNGITLSRILVSDGSTFSGNDIPVLAGGGFAPKQSVCSILGAQTVSTTSVEPSPWRFIATRAGDFTMAWDFCISLGDTSSSVEVKVFWTSGTGKAYCTFTAAGTLTFTTSGTASSFALTGTTPPVMGCRCVLTVTGASANCNVYMMFRKTGGVSYSILDGGLGTLREKD